LPLNRGELVDARESPVGVSPPFVWEHVDGVSVEVHSPRSERNGEANFDSSEAHETEITIGVQVVAVGGEKFFELRAPFGERTNT